MSAPGNLILILGLLATFVACTGYAAGRIHQRRHTGSDREAAYRDGYETATHSVFSMAARMIAPRRAAVRASAAVKRDGAEPAVAPGSKSRAWVRSSSSAGAPAAPPSEPSSGVMPASVISLPASSALLSGPSAPVPPPSGPPAAATAAGRPSPKPAEFGFPVPPPPPSGTVPEPAAVGGVRYQRFPDPRTGGETTVLPDIRDLVGGAEPAKGRRVPRPSHPTSLVSGLSFAPSSHSGGRLRPEGPSASVRPSLPGPEPAALAGSSSPSSSGLPLADGSAAEPGSPRGSTSEDVASPVDAVADSAGPVADGRSGSDLPDLVGPAASGGGPAASGGGLGASGGAPAVAPGGAPAVASGPAGRLERGGGRRNLRRRAGHRAAEDVPDAEPASDADPASSSGRHTVPDELVQATTYRLPPDRVFRAKVRDTASLDDDPTTRLVPKPRQS